MFTLIDWRRSAYVFSVIAKVFPNLFPLSFAMHQVRSPSILKLRQITTLVLLGQVLELRARSRTGAAIKALLGLAPKLPDGFAMMALAKKTLRLIRSNEVTVCGFVPVRKYRWME